MEIRNGNRRPTGGDNVQLTPSDRPSRAVTEGSFPAGGSTDPPAGPYHPAMDSFYTSLPRISSFEDVFDLEHSAELPGDWMIVVIDIRDSTKWIEKGHYRDVTFVGAGAIAAVRNACSVRDIPFVFGGDGATLFIPPGDRNAVGRVLLGLEETARDTFGMDLHAGMIRAGMLASEGFPTRVARYRVADGYDQAIFSGPGPEEAERRIKAATTVQVDRMEDLSAAEPDFTGLECRWKEVKGRRGEVVSLLVKADSLDEYRSVLARIDDIYGPEQVRHPVLPTDLHASFRPGHLGRLEPKLRRAPGRRWLYTFRIWIQQCLLLLFIRFDLHVDGTEWRRYLPVLSATTDIRKFDGMLRMVLTGSAEQREAFTRWLIEQERRGLLVSGMHVSDHALVTCLVYERLGDQVHFVDGARGGYTLAARELKAKLNG